MSQIVNSTKLGLVALSESQDVCLPLKQVELTCQIENLVVNVVSKFLYVNHLDKPADATFVFPLDSGVAVYFFEAQYGDRHIIGQCRPTAEAQESYENAVSEGYAAILVQQDEHSDDVFQLNVGNIPAKESIRIQLKYTAQLFVRSSSPQRDAPISRQAVLTLPTVLNPRYAPQETTLQSEFTPILQRTLACNTSAYSLSFTAGVRFSVPIVGITSAHDKYLVSYESDDKCTATATLASEFKSDHDLEMIIALDGFDGPIAAYEHCPAADSGFLSMDCVTTHFMPTIDESVLGVESRNEIVFLIDCSGSMNGSNMNYAKESLLLLLKSLPTNCRFQIIRFGSSHEALFDGPVDYTEDTLNQAMNCQRSLAANMGGTEVYSALQAAFSPPLTGQGWHRQILFLTDGDISNIDEVLGLVRRNTAKARVFAIGLGMGASTALVRGVARNGHGIASFVRDNSQLREAVMKTLAAALQPRAQQIQLDWKIQATDTESNRVTDIEVLAVPTLIPPVFSGHFFTAHALFKRSENSRLSGEVVLKCDIGGQSHCFTVNLTSVMNDPCYNQKTTIDAPLHRLAAKCQLNDLTDQHNACGESEEAAKWRDKIEQLALQTNLMSKFTAFVGVDSKQQKVCSKVISPAPQPQYASTLKCAAFHSGPMQAKKLRNKGVPSLFGRKAKSATAESPRSSMAVRMKEAPPPPPVASAASITNVTTMADHLKLADLQNMNGSWNLNKELASVLGMKLAVMSSGKPKYWPGTKDETINDSVWATALTLAYLHSRLFEESKEWGLFADKAKRWLCSQLKSTKLPSFAKELCDQLIELAKQSIQGETKS